MAENGNPTRDTDVERIEKEPERLYAGKYKTVEEMEHAYAEAERLITEKSERAKALEEVLAARTTGVQGQEEELDEEDAEVMRERFSTEFYQNPGQVIGQFVATAIQQQNQIARVARANIKRNLAEKRSDPLFSTVRESYEAELEKIGDEYMANPQYAEFYKDSLYKQVVGDYFLQENRRQQRSPGVPASSKSSVGSLGVASPQPDEGKGPEVDINARDREMLAGLGLNPDQRKRAAEKFVSSAQEE